MPQVLEGLHRASGSEGQQHTTNGNPNAWHGACHPLAMPKSTSNEEPELKGDNSHSKKPRPRDSVVESPRAAAEKAVANQNKALKSGEESPT